MITISETRNGQQGKPVIGRGFSVLYSQYVFQGSDDLFISHNIAAHAVAYEDDMPPHWSSKNQIVICSYAVDRIGRHFQYYRQLFQSIIGYPPVMFLHHLQSFDTGRTFHWKMTCDLFDFFEDRKSVV